MHLIIKGCVFIVDSLDFFSDHYGEISYLCLLGIVAEKLRTWGRFFKALLVSQGHLEVILCICQIHCFGFLLKKKIKQLRSFCTATKASHIFSTKNISVFVNLIELLTYDFVNF